MVGVTDLSGLQLEQNAVIAAAITGPAHNGKVRSTWPLKNSRRLLITSDRLSAFDRIIGMVPHKGQVLNQLSGWWFEQLADIVKNHAIALIDPQAMIGIDAKALPVEVVVRSRLTGSTSTSILPKYLAGERNLYGHTLPEGLSAHGKLPEPIITPTTKAQAGKHDEAISVEDVSATGLVAEPLWQKVQQVALALFEKGATVAEEAGFILADTKYEFGIDSAGQLILIDEVHTPDSSRFWDITQSQEAISQGKSPQGYDKEPVRLALREAGFTGDGDIPELAESVWIETSRRYIELYERLTQSTFEPAPPPIDQRIIDNIAKYLASN